MITFFWIVMMTPYWTMMMTPCGIVRTDTDNEDILADNDDGILVDMMITP
jgi:hypothetical protein